MLIVLWTFSSLQLFRWIERVLHVNSIAWTKISISKSHRVWIAKAIIAFEMGSITQLAIALTLLHITRRRVVTNMMCELPFGVLCYSTTACFAIESCFSAIVGCSKLWRRVVRSCVSQIVRCVHDVMLGRRLILSNCFKVTAHCSNCGSVKACFIRARRPKSI